MARLLVWALVIGCFPAFSASLPHKLFNGRDLQGWEVVNAGRWMVEDGAIVMGRQPNDSGGGWLVTRRDYGDFVLRLKFKPGSDVFNTGILVRDPGHAKTARPALNGFEIKLAQGDRVENSNGTIWYAASAYLKPLPADRWTEIEVRCEGDHITTFLDGRKMAELHTRRSYKGAIGLHLHGGADQPEVRWKDIEIQELAEAPRDYRLMEERLAADSGIVTPLLDGGLDRASSAGSTWKLENGTLQGSGAGGNGWLLTTQSFSDFVLTFDFKTASKGDAAVGFRLPHDPSRGYEFHIADSDEVNPSASIVDLGRAFMLGANLQRIYRPAKWNQGCIYAEGDHLVTVLNLEKQADVHVSRSREGRIGFRVGPEAAVEFRNISMKRIVASEEKR